MKGAPLAASGGVPFLPRKDRVRGFTLVELLVAMTVLLIIMVVAFSIVSQTGKLWQSTTGKINAFQQARLGFESVTRKLSQATLNTFLGYDDPATPKTYVRQSELHLICGPAASIMTSAKTWSGESNAVRPTHAIFFQAPLGYDSSAGNPNLIHLLNAAGYYLEFNSDKLARPGFLQSQGASALKYRYRLMELSQPSEKLSVYYPAYSAAVAWPAYNGWFNAALDDQRIRPVAENIVALVLEPKKSPADTGNLAPEYRYDSRYKPASTPSLYGTATPENVRLLHRNQLPPMVQVTMVAIDEASAARLARKNGTAAPPLVADTQFVLGSKFSSGSFSDPGDLEALQLTLGKQGITFRVFSTTVSIHGAKWSNN